MRKIAKLPGLAIYVRGVSQIHRFLPFYVSPLAPSVYLCAGLSQRESQVARSPLGVVRVLWLSAARSPGLE